MKLSVCESEMTPRWKKPMHLGLCSGRGRTKAMKRDGLFVLYLRGYISHLLAYKHLFHEVIFLKNLFFSYRHRKVAMNSYIFSLLPIFFFFFQKSFLQSKLVAVASMAEVWFSTQMRLFVVVRSFQQNIL